MAKNIELYNRTVDILYKAYFDDTLQHNNCCACAVGNMVAANCGFTYADAYKWNESTVWWDNVFMTYSESKKQKIASDEYRGIAKRQIDATGYSWKELAKIEHAFETAKKGRSEADYMLNGLVAVLEALKQIHEIDDNTEQVERFRTHRISKAMVL